MHALTALALLLLTGLTLFAALWAARWLAGVGFGRRGVVDAVTPWSDVGYPMALTRAIAGTMGWYLGASLLVIGALFIVGEERADDTSMRVHVISFGPASRAGLVDDDRIVRVDGAPVHDWPALKAGIVSHAGTPAHVEVERRSVIMAFDVVPESGRIEVFPPVEHVDVGLGAAIGRGLVEPAHVVFLTIKGVLGFLGHAEHVDAIGPVGFTQYAVRAEREHMGQSLQIDAMFGAYVLPMVLLVSLGLAFAARRKTA